MVLRHHILLGTYVRECSRGVVWPEPLFTDRRLQCNTASLTPFSETATGAPVGGLWFWVKLCAIKTMGLTRHLCSIYLLLYIEYLLY